MAQTGFTPIKIYSSSTAAAVPLAANLAAGELAINTADGKLFYKDSSGVVQTIASKAGNVNVASFSAGTTGFTPSTATTGAVTLAGTLALANGGTNATSAPAAMASLMGYTSTVTAAGTTTLTNTSSFYQQFTGATTQTVTLPVTSTLTTGWTFHIVNNSTGNVTVNSSGANLVITVLPGTTAMCTCILASGTTAASWEAGLTDFSTATGTGAVVLGTSPTITTPTLTFSTAATVTAGTNAQGQGALTNDYNVVTTAAANPSGVTLPTATVGRRIVIVNKGANPINVYPASGGAIDALAANAAISLPVGGTMEINASTTTLWYSTYNLYTTSAGYATTATAAGTTTLTSLSGYKQYFTGSTTQTVVLPVVTTLLLGRSYEIVNNSTGVLTVNSSGGNLISTVPAGMSGVVTCIAITGTTAASWHFEYTSYDAITGTGAAVFATSPTIASATLTGANTIQGLTVGLGNSAIADNTAVGVSALAANTTGSGNTAVGNSALALATTGTYNIAVGVIPMSAGVVTGQDNIAIGRYAQAALTSGDFNVAVGSTSLTANTTGSGNTGVGHSVLQAVTGSNNVGIGKFAGVNISTGSNNTVIGAVAGSGITTGGNNVVIGGYDGSAAPISATGSNYVVLSDGAGNVRAYWNGANPTFPGNITLSDGTANGVPYLNGSKALTSGTALTFDGTTLAVGSALAVGSVPENWDYTSSSPVQIGKSGFVYGDVYNNAISMSANMVYTNTTGYEYLYSDFASDYTQNAGEHTWSRAVSGTAGNALTFIPLMKLNVNGNLGIGTTSPSASAIVDAQSTTKGVRMPNMTTTQKNAIASPAAGLMVFDTTLAKLCVYTGAAWQTITSV